MTLPVRRLFDPQLKHLPASREFHLRLTFAEWEQLETIAFECGQPIRDTLEQIISDWLEEDRIPPKLELQAREETLPW